MLKWEQFFNNSQSTNFRNYLKLCKVIVINMYLDKWKIILFCSKWDQSWSIRTLFALWYINFKLCWLFRNFRFIKKKT